MICCGFEKGVQVCISANQIEARENVCPSKYQIELEKQACLFSNTLEE